MIDAELVLSQARQGSTLSTWKIFSRKRSSISGFFSGTLHDPDPLTVFTSEAVIQSINEKKPPIVIEFAHLSKIELKIDWAPSVGYRSNVWLLLHYLNGEKAIWPGRVGFGSSDLTLEMVQYFIEAHARYKALHSNEIIEKD